MNLLGVENLSSHTSASTEEDFLIRMILLTHNPDGSELDSILLLRAVENIVLHATSVSGVSDPEIYATSICTAEEIGLQESLLFKISNQIHHRCFLEGDIHTKTMFLFEMLGNFRWDAKVVLVLAAFLIRYGEFQLIVQFQSHNPLAALIAILRRVPSDVTPFKRQFKVLIVLVKTMIELTKAIVEFENLPLQQELLEFKAISVAKSKIYISSYWIFRSSFACFSLLTGFSTTKNDQVHVLSLNPCFQEDSNPTTVAAWTISSLFYRLSGLCYELRELVDTCHRQIGTRLSEKLLNLFESTHINNQEKLQMLIPLKDDFPLKDCLSDVKHGISELKNKVVILLVSKPELLPIERIFMLVQQTYDHLHHKKVEGNYVILWYPISSSHTWTQTDLINFHILSNSLPFWTLRQPWTLDSAIVNFFTREWNFKEDEVTMVVLDDNGRVTNSNAMDMVWIWGAESFPFSISREKELWEMQDWTLQLILDHIDPLLTSWIDQAKNICIYASNNLDWIRSFCTKMKVIQETGLQLEVIYVGWQNPPSERLQEILDIIKKENLSAFLSFSKIYLFWLRLMSMKNSIIRHNNDASGKYDHILKEVTGMLEAENADDGWVMIGKGPSADIEKLQGSKLSKIFDLFPVWAENVEAMGVMGAIRSAFKPPLPVRPCYQSEIFPYEEGLIKGSVICKECKCPREKFVVYKCEENN